MATFTALTVIKDKFYIIESRGSKVGTLKLNEKGKYVLYSNVDNTETVYDDLSEFVVKEKKTKTGPVLLIRFDGISSLKQATRSLAQLLD